MFILSSPDPGLNIEKRFRKFPLFFFVTIPIQLCVNKTHPQYQLTTVMLNMVVLAMKAAKSGQSNTGTVWQGRMRSRHI